MNLINGRGIRRLLGSNQDTINSVFIKEVSLNFLKSDIEMFDFAAFLLIIYEM